MKNRFFITNIMMLMTVLTSFAYDFEVDGIYYDVIDTYALTCGVSGVSDQNETSTIIIPNSVFYSGKDLKVIKVLDNAFMKSKIKSIILPSTCSSIGSSAFWGCSELASISIPEGVTTIGTNAFNFCTSLTEVNIPSSITQIDKYAFSNCNNLTNVIIQDINAWCKIKFEAGWCNNLSNTYTSNPLSNMSARLVLNGDEITSLDTKDYNITSINDGCFVGYQGLTFLKLSNETESIGRYSFWNCTNLQNVFIGSSIVNIPYLAFGQCTNLTNLYIDDSNSELQFEGGKIGDNYNDITKDYYSGDFRDSKLQSVYIGRNLSRPDIKNRRFYSIFEKQDIDSLSIGPSVTNVTNSYFNGDNGSGKITNIHNLIIYSSTVELSCVFNKRIDYGTLSQGPLMYINPESLILGRDLKAAYIFDYINFAGVNSFLEQSNNLTSLEIGENVSDISYLNLDKNNNISTIVVKATVPPSCTAQIFPTDVYMHSIVNVPIGYKSIYKDAPIWKNFWNIEEADLSAITPIVADDDVNQPVLYYNLNGLQLSEEPTNGIYILRQGNSVTKVIK